MTTSLSTLLSLLFTELMRLFVKKPAAVVMRHRWYAPVVKDEFRHALREFQLNIDAYRRGKISWDMPGRLPSGERYNAVQVHQAGGEYFMVYCRFERDQVYSRMTQLAKKKISREKYNAFEGSWVTWCNQVSGIFCFHITGTDMDYFLNNHLDANEVCANLAAGTYNTAERRFREVSYEEAVGVALAGGFALGALDRTEEDKRGHQAVINQEPGSKGPVFIQSGVYTGTDILPARAFGKENLDRVKYYVFEVYGNGKAKQ